MTQQPRTRAFVTGLLFLAAGLVAGCEPQGVLPPYGDCEIDSDYRIDCSPDELPIDGK